MVFYPRIRRCNVVWLIINYFDVSGLNWVQVFYTRLSWRLRTRLTHWKFGTHHGQLLRWRTWCGHNEFSFMCDSLVGIKSNTLSRSQISRTHRSASSWSRCRSLKLFFKLNRFDFFFHAILVSDAILDGISDARWIQQVGFGRTTNCEAVTRDKLGRGHRILKWKVTTLNACISTLLDLKVTTFKSRGRHRSYF